MGTPGSQRQVQKLVDEHYLPLYRYAYRLSGSGPDAEDLTQEAFCKAQLHMHQLRDAASAKPWLFRILRNVYLQRIRAEKNQHCVSLEDMGELPDDPPPSIPPIEPERLQEALNQLPEVFRTPVILYYFDEFSYRDIAEQMDLPIGTVMSRLARAKVYIRNRLSPELVKAGSNGAKGARDGL
jgi:RNA polymerase sigma-70 factor (ECF subfamily)